MADSNPVVVKTKIDLSGQSDSTSVSVTVKARGAARLAFGIELFKGSSFIETKVKFPDKDDLNIPFRLDPVSTLRGLNIDCFGRVFAGQPDTITVWCEFSIDGETFATSGEATMTLTEETVTQDFHLKCLFV